MLPQFVLVEIWFKLLYYYWRNWHVDRLQCEFLKLFSNSTKWAFKYKIWEKMSRGRVHVVWHKFRGSVPAFFELLWHVWKSAMHKLVYFKVVTVILGRIAHQMKSHITNFWIRHMQITDRPPKSQILEWIHNKNQTLTSTHLTEPSHLQKDLKWRSWMQDQR